MSSRTEPESGSASRRIETFSDAVFVIILAITVLGLRIPDTLAVTSDRLAFEEFIGVLGVFAVTFVVVMILWASHHYLIFTIRYPNRTTVWLNNLVLFCVTLIPIAARFFGTHPTSPRAAAAYAFVLTICTASFCLLRGHAAQISHIELHRAIHDRIVRKSRIAILVYLASIPLAFVDVRLVWIGLLAAPLLFYLPTLRPFDQMIVDEDGNPVRPFRRTGID